MLLQRSLFEISGIKKRRLKTGYPVFRRRFLYFGMDTIWMDWASRQVSRSLSLRQFLSMTDNLRSGFLFVQNKYD